MCLPTTLSEHASLWGEDTFIFFQVYLNIQRCSRFVSLEKQKDSTCIRREISLELPFGVEFILTEKQKLLWIRIYRLIGKHESLCLLIYTYVQSWQQPEEIQSGCLWWLRSGVLCGELHHLLMISAPVAGVPPDFWSTLDQQCTGASFQVL